MTRIALVFLFAVVSMVGQPANVTRDTRLAQIVEADITATHAFQVLMRQKSGKRPWLRSSSMSSTSAPTIVPGVKGRPLL